MSKVNTLNQRESGFTIIEVVLVLAIAGLIFLMVFIALPALQRSQRDSQRRSDAGMVLSQVTNYQTDNRGQVPGTSSTALNSFQNTYFDAETFVDPTDGEYDITTGGDDADPKTPDTGRIYYYTNRICGEGGKAEDEGAGARNVAVRISLEGGGVYCQNN